MKSPEQHWVRPLRGLLGRLPELFLRGVPVHGTDSEETIPELLWNVREISRLRADHHSVINQTEINRLSVTVTFSDSYHGKLTSDFTQVSRPFVFQSS